MSEILPIDILLHCPVCQKQHVDQAEPDSCENCGHVAAEHFSENINISPTIIAACDCCDHGKFAAWLNPPHKSHRCHYCNHVWRPADYPTNGVEKINAETSV